MPPVTDLLVPRRDPAQVVGEVEDEHDLVLHDDAGLIRLRGRRDPRAVGISNGWNNSGQAVPVPNPCFPA
jgi:hypothetical protein